MATVKPCGKGHGLVNVGAKENETRRKIQTGHAAFLMRPAANQDNPSTTTERRNKFGGWHPKGEK